MERIQKIIAQAGIASRRKAEQLIVDGLVKLNGEIVTELGTKASLSSDLLEVDGRMLGVQEKEEPIYLAFHKPRQVITSSYDPEGRTTVLDYCREIPQRIYPVGRLDYLSEGLLILTNDGQLANVVGHPSHRIQKIYEVKVFGHLSKPVLNKLRAGIRTENGDFLKPKSVRIVGQLERKTWLEFVLEEGKNREIRRLCEACGLTIDKLKRVAIENLTITGVAPGNYRLMSKREILRALNLNQKMEKIDRPTQQLKLKKAVPFKKYEKGLKRSQKFVAANDEKFAKYKKENYKATMNHYKKLNSEKEEKSLEKKAK